MKSISSIESSNQINTLMKNWHRSMFNLSNPIEMWRRAFFKWPPSIMDVSLLYCNYHPDLLYPL